MDVKINIFIAFKSVVPEYYYQKLPEKIFLLTT